MYYIFFSYKMLCSYVAFFVTLVILHKYKQYSFLLKKNS